MYKIYPPSCWELLAKARDVFVYHHGNLSDKKKTFKELVKYHIIDSNGYPTYYTYTNKLIIPKILLGIYKYKRTMEICSGKFGKVLFEIRTF